LNQLIVIVPTKPFIDCCLLVFVLTEQKSLLDLALKAVIEALRMNPDRYAVIYNSKYDDNCNIFDSGSNIATASSSSPCTATKPQNHNHYYDQYHEGILER
jgi:hypothetical protein